MEKRRVAKPIFLQIAKGLKALHDRGIAHLDFHPGNVMIEVSEERGQPVFGQVKVMDFGTSVSVNPYMPEPAGGEVGKNLYLSPEMREKRPVTTKADVFGLGQMMYKFFEGRQFSGDIGALEFRNIQDESLQVLIRSFLQPDPEDRGSVDDLFRCAFFRS